MNAEFRVQSAELRVASLRLYPIEVRYKIDGGWHFNPTDSADSDF